MTYRSDTLASELVEHLRKEGAQAALVTDPDGVLVGVLRREQAERVLQTGN